MKLIEEPDVVQWIKGDLSFLPSFNIEGVSKTKKNKILKEEEDVWGKEKLKLIRPDLKPASNWTTCFGERICLEILEKDGLKTKKHEKKGKYIPDLETEEHVFEVKTGTYFTEGTAHEKILGTPFKYADIPVMTGKPLIIFIIGGSEKRCIEDYGFLGNKNTTPAKRKYLNFLNKEMNIYCVGATQLL